MAINQSGREPVATTTQGTPRDVSEDNAKPTDLVKEGKSDKAKGGDQRNVIASRTQATEAPSTTPPMQPHMVNRPQNVGDGPRFNTASVPKDGSLVPPTPTKQPSRGTGSVGNTAKPFKGMR